MLQLAKYTKYIDPAPHFRTAGDRDEGRHDDGRQRGAHHDRVGERLVPEAAVLSLSRLHHQVQPQHGRHIFTGERHSLVLDVSGHIRLSALFLP